MIGIKYSDGSVLYNLRNNKLSAMVFIQKGKIKVLKDITGIKHKNVKVSVESEKVTLLIISKISHEAICEIVNYLDPNEPYYEFVKSLTEKK